MIPDPHSPCLNIRSEQRDAIKGEARVQKWLKGGAQGLVLVERPECKSSSRRRGGARVIVGQAGLMGKPGVELDARAKSGWRKSERVSNSRVIQKRERAAG